MDNKQWTVIGLGCLALSSLYYFFQQYSHESKHYKQRRKEIRDAKISVSTSGGIINFEKIKQDKPVHILLPKAQVKTIPPDAFTISYRQIKRGLLPSILTDPFLEKQTGGRITISQNSRDITVDLKNCNISMEALKGQKSKCIIFSQNKDKEALYYSLSYTLKAAKNLAIYGVLKYSFSQKKFIMEPQFLLQTLKQPEEVVQKIAAFWDEKIYRITFKKLVIVFGMVTLGYLLIYKPLKSIVQRAKIRREGVSQGQFDYFKEKVKFGARPRGALKCEYCLQANISYVYECGHLVACQDCYKKDKEYKCLICKKKSKKFMKIFI